MNLDVGAAIQAALEEQMFDDTVRIGDEMIARRNTHPLGQCPECAGLELPV